MGGIVNIGVVGLGFMGKKHIECYSKMDNVKIAGAVARSIEGIRKKENYPFNLYGTVEELLENEAIDAVDICLPTVYHREAVIKALNRKLDVIVEKPFALHIDEVEDMINCSVKNRKKLMVAHVCRFMPEYIFAKEKVESGELGKPLYYYALRNSPTPQWSSNNWLADKNTSGGTVMDLQIHDIDIANWLLGDAVDFNLTEIYRGGEGATGFGHVLSTIKYSNDGVAVLEAGHLMPPRYQFTTAYRLICEKGAVEFHRGFNSLTSFVLFRENEVLDMTAEYIKKYESFDPYMAELEHFIQCIQDGREFRITVGEAKNAVYVAGKLSGVA